MKTRLLYSTFILSLAAVILSFSFNRENYLPTVIYINLAGMYEKELSLHLRASFAVRKIKTINKEEALELQKKEIERVLIPYYENLKKSGNNLNFDELRTYMALNQRKVCNSLSIEINVSDKGFIKDTIKWSSYTLPFEFINKKREQHVLVLTGEQKSTLINITQLITDSIIASNVLVKQY